MTPQNVARAQAAIQLPEVQDMLRRLSEHDLGIFMPHMHDELTGELRRLPDDVMQVESDLAVSFLPTAEIASQKDRFLPVAWMWRAGALTPAAACEMVWDDGQSHEECPAKHKMSERI